MQHEVPRSCPNLVIGQSKGVRARVVKVNFGIEDLTDRLVLEDAISVYISVA